MRLLTLISLVVLSAITPLAALAAPKYPRYIQRQLDQGSLTIDEAELLLEGGLGQKPPVATTSARPGYQLYFGGGSPAIDPLTAAIAESERNNRLNEERYYADIRDREDRFYLRNQPAFVPFGRFYRPRIYHPGFFRR